ncbi:sodium-dependent glucose transporter 1A-like [Haliotis rubra]|uniref:sodium-dependent glucose transporter 1A-like n=1 Tax=Haliotis rubra TaxID=36100 RepID=UPI001EE63519|nr:sodium-dependent glucose transporter 1A-like [Haliotis rubra]
MAEEDNFEEEDQRASFRQKLKHSGYRRKFLHTIVLFLSFAVLGVCDTIHYPAFLDLALITGTNIEQASVFYTAMSVGGLVGSVVMGFLFDKLTNHRLFLLAASNIGGAVTLAAIPWSSNYHLTIFIFFINYVFNLAFDTGTHADLLNTWGKDGKMFLQFLHFSYALGTILSPLIAEPFLAELGGDNSTHQSSQHVDLTRLLPNNTADLTPYAAVKDNSTIPVYDNHPKSQIQYAYCIAGLLFLFSALLMGLEGCVNRKKPKCAVVKEDHREIRELQPRTKVIVLVIVSVIYFFHCASGLTISGYMMAFCVQDRGWSKETSSYLAAVFWAVFAASRLGGVFVIKYISPLKLMFLCNCLLTLSVSGLWVGVAAQSDTWVWICIIATSIGAAVFFPTGFIRVETDIMPVTGMVAGIMMLATNAAGIVNPLLVGYLMQEVSPKWYVYVTFAEVVVCFVCCFVLDVVVKTMVTKQRSNLSVPADEDGEEKFVAEHQSQQNAVTT